MLLRIQQNESLRSYVERNLFVPNIGLNCEVLQSLSHWDWDSSHVKLIAKLLGWHGCYGFNKLLHEHTIYPLKSVLKSKFNHSYSNNEYNLGFTQFGSSSEVRSYCPLCTREDKLQLGYSYWRRIFPEIKVCAKHNVVLLTACQFCDKPFGKRGHAGSVMWSGCSGRHLEEAQPVENLDPSALRLAQFFEDLCQADHHIHIDTAALVIEKKLMNKIGDNPNAPLEKQTESEFRRYIEKSEMHDEIVMWPYQSFSTELFGFVTSIYETFVEFAADCHKLESNAPTINSFWDAYCCFGQPTQHFIREDYRLGVAEWSWPGFQDLSRDLFLRENSLLMWSAGKYLCCIPPDAHSSIDNLFYAPHPKVPRLTQDELLAMTE